MKLQQQHLSPMKRGTVRWKTSDGDMDFFRVCMNKLREYPIKTILDVACGKGEFVAICNREGLDAWGIDPSNKGYRICKGTFESLIRTESFPIMDCITVHNTLHGKYHIREEIQGLFDFFQEHTKYVVISEPNYKELGLPRLTRGFMLLHTFKGSHDDKGVIHKLYKINKG